MMIVKDEGQVVDESKEDDGCKREEGEGRSDRGKRTIWARAQRARLAHVT